VDELVVIDVVASEPEAELLCSRLRNEEIPCTHRVSNFGAGAADGLSVGGPHEVLVRPEDLERAREIVGER
jgi:hypothetical protein